MGEVGNLRVCHITDVHSRYDGRIFQKECRSLAKAGYEVYLVVCDDKPDEVIDGVNIVSTGYKPCGRVQRFLTSPRSVLKKAKEIDADLYHFHDPELLTVAKRLNEGGKTVIFDCHDFTYYQIHDKAYIPEWLRTVIAGIYKYYEKEVVRKIDGVVTPCTVSGKNYFEKIARETILIDNFPIIESEDITINHSGTEFKCIYVGSISRTRGAIKMCEASKKAGVKLILAGPVDDDVKDVIAEYEDAGIVEYKGILSRHEISDMIRQSNVGLSVIQNEKQYYRIDNLPTKVYEYMRGGIPVILSRRDFTEKFMETNNIGILVHPENVDEISDAMFFLKNHQQEALRMGENGIKAVEQKYNWEVQAEKLISFYRRLLSS